MWRYCRATPTRFNRLSFTVSMATRALETCAWVDGGQPLQRVSPSHPHRRCQFPTPSRYPVDWQSWWEGKRVIVKSPSMPTHLVPISTPPHCSPRSSNGLMFQTMTSLWRRPHTWIRPAAAPSCVNAVSSWPYAVCNTPQGCRDILGVTMHINTQTSSEGCTLLSLTIASNLIPLLLYSPDMNPDIRLHTINLKSSQAIKIPYQIEDLRVHSRHQRGSSLSASLYHILSSFQMAKSHPARDKKCGLKRKQHDSKKKKKKISMFSLCCVEWGEGGTQQVLSSPCQHLSGRTTAKASLLPRTVRGDTYMHSRYFHWAMWVLIPFYGT